MNKLYTKTIIFLFALIFAIGIIIPFDLVHKSIDILEGVGQGFSNLHTLYINSSDSSPDGGIVEDTVQNDDPEDSVLAVDVIASNLMLNWVINCESSGIHKDRWGAEDEYGILQYKSETWDFLSGKYNYVGEWQNQDDQIILFMLTSDKDKEHWTCWRKYQNL